MPIVGENDFGTIYPELVPEWDPDNELRPSDVLPKSNEYVGWICPKGHKWPAKICHRAEGRGCPYCAGLLPIIGETDTNTRLLSTAVLEVVGVPCAMESALFRG